jgi:hypothetical protein
MFRSMREAFLPRSSPFVLLRNEHKFAASSTRLSAPNELASTVPALLLEMKYPRTEWIIGQVSSETLFAGLISSTWSVC